MFSINKAKGDQQPNDFELAPYQRLHILTGANMSGKTFHLKQIAQTQLIAQATGLAPADNATLPIFSKVVYFDRPGNEEGRDLSAFATEINQWNRILRKLEDKQRALVIIDEPFSSTSPRYQAALAFALVEKLIAAGHTVVMATHHHELAEKLASLYPNETDLAHFAIHKEDDDDNVTFLHTKQSGHAPSDALVVARAIGGPIMQRILANTQ
jgi:DNA mismatch repair protein MutS